jgi:ubiquinone/menaquinone biosynthesis C-methylase UbiE
MKLPPYFDALVAARRAGAVGRDVHLGYWDDPPPLTDPVRPGEFERAQRRLTERIVDRLPLQPGLRVLDVGCGFGAAMAAMEARRPGLVITGLNIDARQLALCRGAASRLTLVQADACTLPFADGSFDHALCIEAMFHFASRAQFLAEAARVVRPCGVLVGTDILLRKPPGSDAILAILRRDYGPWPDPWGEATPSDAWDILSTEDWTAATLPTYRTVAPSVMNRPETAGDVLRRLHETGWLTYRMFAYRRR